MFRDMGALTEVEIFACLRENFRLAAQYCEDLAKLPAKGPTYIKLRESLKLLEGCCKQASAWREDTRWLGFGLMMAECHKRAGDWLRGITTDEGVHIKLAPRHINQLFSMLAENLRGLAAIAEKCRTDRTNKVGMILPEVQRAPLRTQGRQVSVLLPQPKPNISPNGLLLPHGVCVG